MEICRAAMCVWEAPSSQGRTTKIPVNNSKEGLALTGHALILRARKVMRNDLCETRLSRPMMLEPEKAEECQSN